MQKYVEGVVLNMAGWPGVLERVERDFSALIDHNHFAVNEVSGGSFSQARAIAGNRAVKMVPRRDQSTTPGATASYQTAIAVQLGLIRPEAAGLCRCSGRKTTLPPRAFTSSHVIANSSPCALSSITSARSIMASTLSTIGYSSVVIPS